MTPGKQPHVFVSVCSPHVCYPEGHRLGVSLLMLLLALQRIIVPLVTGTLTGPAFLCFKCKVRHLGVLGEMSARTGQSVGI